jgi:hypothetical protein
MRTTMEQEVADKEMLGRRSTDLSTEAQLTEDPERLAQRKRAHFHGKVLIGGLIITVVLGLALGLGLGLTVGRYRS